MAKSDQDPFYYKVEQLEELVKRQQKALEIAKDLLNLKDELLDLTEQQVELYKKHTNRLRRALLICCVWMIIMSIISLIRLLA